jgi:hypothetical protein
LSAWAGHACGIDGDGAIQCWGDDDHGQLAAPDGRFTALSAGREFTCAIDENAELHCWGYDDAGQTSPPAGRFQQVSAGWFHACAVRDDGSATCWGSLFAGQAPEGAFTMVSAGYFWSCGLRPDGKIDCWNDYAVYPMWQDDGPFTRVAVGDSDDLCAIRTNGTLRCNATASFEDTPTGSFSDVDLQRIRACAITVDGSVECWGSSSYVVFVPSCGRHERCGQPRSGMTSDKPVSRDALEILRAATGIATDCSPDDCMCDVDSSGIVTAVDAFATLKSAVAGDVVLDCSCGGGDGI